MIIRHVHPILILSLAVLTQLSSRSLADCAPCYVSLNDMDSITEKGGYPSCPVSFAPGVNDNGVVLDGNCHITFPDLIFNGDAGSVSFWFRNDDLSETKIVRQLKDFQAHGHPQARQCLSGLRFHRAFVRAVVRR